MPASRFHTGALLAGLLLTLSPTSFGQTTPGNAALAPASQTFSQQELDQLLAPIALYPDALLAQIFMAATYPLEVVEAARWVKANPTLNGKSLEDALTKKSWDPAVKSLTTVPQVLQQMNDKLEWTQKLGDAFLAQQAAVMDTVQSLRAKADAAGNLKSSDQQVVKTQSQGSQTIYVVEPAKPEVIYVPTYNPSVVYGSWWYPAPPYYMYPPSYVYPPGLAFATGVVVGAAIWGSCNWGWGHGHVDVNVNRYNSFNRTNISNKNWNHNVEHRRGVAYRDQNVAREYNRGGTTADSKTREDFRGRAEAGREELKTMDRNEPQGRGQPGERRYSVQNRDASRDTAAASRFDGSARESSRPERERSGDAFAGLSNGAGTREASQRGNASRSDISQRSAGRSDFGSAGGGQRGGGGGRGRR